jgi:diacylglycerol kinase (ATP)
MSDFKQALVIYNPASGTVGDLDKRLGAIVRRLHEEQKYMVTVRATTPNISAQELLASELGEFELVIACGGDGTVGVVLGAVAELNSKARVGIVPFGTGNLLAHNLGIYPPKLKGDVLYAALDTILDGDVVSMDLGKLNDRWFTVDAGTGPISNALTVPRQRHKRFWRLFVYVLPLLKSMARGPRAFKISIDDEAPVMMPASGVFITTIGEMGIGNAYDYSQLNNGTLDLIVMNPKSLRDYWRITWRFAAWNIFGTMPPGEPPYLVRKIRSADIDVLAASHLKSPVHKWARKIKNFLMRKPDFSPAVTDHATAMVDGDRCGSTPMHVQIVPNAVQLIVPKLDHKTAPPSLQRIDNVVPHAA